MTSPPAPSVTSSPSITVFAPAKINLILRILDRRADGYHNLWSIMQTVAIQDELRIRLSPDCQHIRLGCDSQTLAADHTNLVYKAAAAVLDRAGKTVGLEIELKKRIPMGAGLGGGSSDAAATIIGLNRLLGLGYSEQQLSEIGQFLGSDVSFFFHAPSAVVSGRGEVVKPIALDGLRWVVLINPGFGIETRWAYHELAATRQSVRALSENQEELNRRTQLDWTQLGSAAENDFEDPVFAKHGALREIKRTLLTCGAEMALLSGSGATVFGIFKDERDARRTQAHFHGDKQLKTFAVPTCSHALTVQ
ncbi:MAG TPA: 4-(cytidine 5'-diphospho)-2-C-methyl-D-erythritol kinase [Nitrospira sp.]